MFRKRIAVDLGTANILVHTEADGIIANEPSVVAVDTESGKIIAVGRDAKEYIGKTPKKISAIRPLKNGVIADFVMAQTLITHFLKRAMGSGLQGKPDVLICVPTNITDVERRAVTEAAMHSGARSVRLIEEPVAAAIGAGLPVLEARGSMVVDMGGGTTDIAVIALGSMVSACSLKLAGDALTEAVQRCLQEDKQLVIGENMAERVKITLGSLYPLEQPLTASVSGKDLSTASPKTLEISDADIHAALLPAINKIIETIRSQMERTPPELAVDIMQQGLLLTGGGALLRGMAQKIAEATALPVHIDKEPLTTVLRGAGIALASPDAYADVLISC